MKRICLLLCCFTFILSAVAQTVAAPFQQEIDAFRKKDSIQMPATGAILFAGSSSFTKWKDIGEYFPGYPLINRGFGGSSLPDVIRYAQEVILKYHPKQVIIYCGENDIANNASATVVLERFRQLYAIIRARFKSIPVDFISIKPSPDRWKHEQVIVEANRLIEQFLSGQPNARFIDVHQDMLNADGSVKGELFISDRLHMNARGYAIWQKRIAPLLLSNQ